MKIVYDLMVGPEDDKFVNGVLDKLISTLSKKHNCLRIFGADIAGDVDMHITESALNNVAKALYKNKDYDYTKCLWIQYPNGDEIRLDNVIDYDD